MNKTPSFFKAILPSNSRIQTDYWDTVIDTYNKGNFKDTMISLLTYINPDIPKNYGNKELTEFQIPHGSIIVSIKIEDDFFSVDTPFIKLPPKNQIPLLRRTAEINFSPLTLSSIVLQGDELKFQYSAPLNLCEPFKIYYLFREICLLADRYDDEFIQKFGASRFREPKVRNFTSEQVEKILSVFQLYLSEATEYVNYFENKRMEGFLWDILIQTFMSLDYYAQPQGVLRSEVETTISVLVDNYAGVHDRIEKGKALLKKLQAYKQEDFANNFFISEIFIPSKYIASYQVVKDNFKKSYEGAQKEIANTDFMGATLTLRYIFLYQFYYSYPPPNVAEVMTAALIESSGKSWNDSAVILFNAIDRIIKGDLPAPKAIKEIKENGKKSKSIFGKIFGN